MRISCLALIVLALLMPTAFAARVALVIGNGAYKDSPLKNPANDARDMSAKLKELGFTVIAKENLKRKEITPTLRQFRSQIKPGDEVLFFYAGHGLQVKGVNYLPTVDAEIDSEDDVPLESINVSSVLELLDESKAAVKLVFLDACRNNPYARSFRSADRGLSRVGNVAPSGTLISFATKPGSVAADGNGRNGLYTEQLLKYMGSENTQVEQVLKNVIRDVKKGSNGEQEPWSEGSLEGDFYFRQTVLMEQTQGHKQVVQLPMTTVVATNPIIIEGRYLLLGDGSEVRDQKTGLIWRRCVEGMRWDGSSCTGVVVRLGYNKAEQLSKDAALSSDKKWRIPSTYELDGLLDKNQKGTKINPLAFPQSPADKFWSSTITNNISGANPLNWTTSFETGYTFSSMRVDEFAVRLVRQRSDD